jgi:hypothetical protein
MHGLGFSLREIKELTDLRTDKIEACESVRDLRGARVQATGGEEQSRGQIDLLLWRVRAGVYGIEISVAWC